jgi:FMN reductase [NAD(P)H]
VQKPRLPLATFRHDERYREEGMPEAFDAYDRELLAHWKATGRADGQAWTDSIAGFYSKVYFPAMKAAVEAQGFRLDR